MRLRTIEAWTNEDMTFLMRVTASAKLKDITWYRMSDTCIICHAFDAVGRDTIGVAVGRPGSPPSLLCRKSLYDAIARGAYVEVSPFSGEEELEAI